MTVRRLRYLAALPVALIADVLLAVADHIDTKLADAINGEGDE